MAAKSINPERRSVRLPSASDGTLEAPGELTLPLTPAKLVGEFSAVTLPGQGQQSSAEGAFHRHQIDTPTLEDHPPRRFDAFQETRSGRVRAGSRSETLVFRLDVMGGAVAHRWQRSGWEPLSGSRAAGDPTRNAIRTCSRACASFWGKPSAILVKTARR